ncbi:3-hydroxybutyryl-CoA dehydrogenase [Friedmanniella luteola]|uniref:3-hydroxybutyryl-CoA dehydrogenase n=2 Tax=Friedmanniella luteola TaxID=546871 RepID=A0A1H1V2H5_9ACTN|nr:3-hydroxybutyryl-CoA dehydrogenase [Friedmanniella luteola]
MGSGIAEVFARGGWSVVGLEEQPDALDRARQRLAASTARAVERGKLDAAGAEALTARVSWATDVAALAGCDVVVEAVPEVPELKRAVFSKLDAVLSPDALLATNTSSLSVTALAAGTSRPGRVVGVHFFNPAPVQPLVEVVSTVLSDPAAVARARAVLEELGKTTIACRDRAGFVVNALLVPYLNHAASWYEHGYATREEIDAAMVAAGLPMGPLALLDLVGHDVTHAVLHRLHGQTGERRHLPTPLLTSLVEGGLLGRKSGRGFYTYAADGSVTDDPGLVPPPPGSRAGELPEALLVPYLNDVLTMVGVRYTSAADADTGMALGCRMPKPFDQLAALGPATVLARQQQVFAETAEPGHRPAPLLEQLAAADDPDLALHALRTADEHAGRAGLR